MPASGSSIEQRYRRPTRKVVESVSVFVAAIVSSRTAPQSAGARPHTLGEYGGDDMTKIAVFRDTVRSPP